MTLNDDFIIGNKTKQSHYSIGDFQTFHDVFFAIYTTVAFFSFLFNVIVFTIYLFMKKSLRSRKSNLLLCLQSCVDFVVSISNSLYGYFINTFVDIGKYGALRTNPYNVLDFIFKFSQLLAITSLFVFTCERFIAFTFPMFHRSHITSKRILFTLLCTSLLSTVPSSIFTYYIYTYRREAAGFLEVYFIVMSTVNVAFIFAIFVLLVIAYRKIRKSFVGTAAKKSAIASKTESKQRRDNEKQKRVLIIFIAMCTTYTLTFLPLAIWKQFYPSIFFRTIMDFHTAVIINFTFVLMYHLSALINPLITMTFIKDYKDTLRYLVLKRFCTKNDDDIHLSTIAANHNVLV